MDTIKHEKMLKNIETSRNECTTKCENNVGYYTDYCSWIDWLSWGKDIKKHIEMRKVLPFLRPIENKTQIYYFQNFIVTQYIRTAEWNKIFV